MLKWYIKKYRKILSYKINVSYLYTLENEDKIGISEESELTLEVMLIDFKKIYYDYKWGYIKIKAKEKNTPKKAQNYSKI